jgi:hypothetical protein
MYTSIQNSGEIHLVKSLIPDSNEQKIFYFIKNNYVGEFPFGKFSLVLVVRTIKLSVIRKMKTQNPFFCLIF